MIEQRLAAASNSRLRRRARWPDELSADRPRDSPAYACPSGAEARQSAFPMQRRIVAETERSARREVFCVDECGQGPWPKRASGVSRRPADRTCRGSRPQRLAPRLAVFAARAAGPGRPSCHCCGVWIWRKPIADDYIRDELERRGVPATYTLDRIGFRNQSQQPRHRRPCRIPTSSPRPPQSRCGSSGTAASRPTALSPAACASGGSCKSGQGKLGPGRQAASAADPQAVRAARPDVDLKDTTVALATPSGPMGFAVEGLGNLSGGFKGRLAVAARAGRPAPARSTGSAPLSTSGSLPAGRK